MGIWHARFWVFLALLSLLLELGQGPRPVGAWWASESLAADRQDDRRKDDSLVALAVTDGEGDEDSEGGEPDSQPGEDSDGKPDREPSEESGEEDDEELGKKQLDPARLCLPNPHSFAGPVSSLVRLGSATKLSDLTYHEAPERPPRTV